MHAVNALLRAELAGALARVDTAESPPLRQRPSTVPHESSTAASPGRTASASASEKGTQTAKAWTFSPVQTGSPSLSNDNKTANDPNKKGQLERILLDEDYDDDRATPTFEQSTAKSPHCTSFQAKPAMSDLTVVILLSMTALRLRMARQLPPCDPAERRESIQGAADSSEQQAPLEEAPETMVHDEHAQLLRALEERLQQEHALTRQHMQEAHAQELQALRESLSAEHACAAASLARQHSGRHASECERMTSRLTEEHVKALKNLQESLQQEHAAALHALRCQHAHELAESRESVKAELSRQYAAAEGALRESLEKAHAASVQQQLAEQAEKLSLSHAQASNSLARDREALREQLKEEHVVTCQQLQEMHAQELEACERQLMAQHAQQVQDMTAQHTQLTLRMEQGFLEERRRLEEENECQLALVQELATEQAHAQLQGDPVKASVGQLPPVQLGKETHLQALCNGSRSHLLLAAHAYHGCAVRWPL